MVADMLSNWRNNLSRLQHYTLTMEGHSNSANPERTKLQENILKDGKDERAMKRKEHNKSRFKHTAVNFEETLRRLNFSLSKKPALSTGWIRSRG